MIRPASALQNVGLHPILTFSPAFRKISTMKTMSQVGLTERVPVPPKKRFLIHTSLINAEQRRQARISTSIQGEQD